MKFPAQVIPKATGPGGIPRRKPREVERLMDAVKYLEATAVKMPISSNTMKDDPNNVLLMFNHSK